MEELISIKNSNKIEDKQYQVIGIIGEWKAHHNGCMNLTLDIFKEIIFNYRNNKIAIPCDYDHALLSSNSSEASGWIEIEDDSLIIEDNKLLAKISWTKKAKERIKNREYRYLSPVFDSNTVDSVNGENLGWSLHSVALTNKPFIEDLDEVLVNSKDFINLKSRYDKLLSENLELKNEIDNMKLSFITREIDGAIKQNLFSNSQKESLLNIGKNDYTLLKNLIKNTKPVGNNLVNNIYANRVYETNNKNKLSRAEMEA